MDMHGALRARLLAVADIAARVETINWSQRPQASGLPGITLQTITAPRDQHMDGPQVLQWVRVQADTWANSNGEGLAIANAIVAEMEQPRTVDGVNFRRASVEGPADRGEQGATSFIHRKQVDLMFFYSYV